MSKFKIDVNCYDSDTFPVALYKWIPGRWFGGKWKHVNSYRDRDEAREFVEKVSEKTKDLPIYL